MNIDNLFCSINKRHIHTLLMSVLVIASSFIYTDAYATQPIMKANGAPSCATCHTGGKFTKAEGQAGLAAFLASKTPTCVAPQVLNASKKACVNPSTPPTCVAPQVLNASQTACINPPKPTPNCVAPQVLQNNVCITPVPTACGNDEDEDYDSESYDSDENESNDEHSESNDKHSNERHSRSKKNHKQVVPTLSAPDQVSVHAGEPLKLAVTAFDCNDRPIKIKASHLPKGAKIVNSIDPELHMPKAVITWNSPASSQGKSEKVVLKAVASDNGNNKVASSPQTVMIEVLPTNPVQGNVDDSQVKANTVASARFKAKKQTLLVSGQVAWLKSSSKDERLALIANQSAIITDANTGMELGTATVGKNGKWKASITVDEATAPCSIDVSFLGKTGVKAVKGLKFPTFFELKY